LHQRNPAAAIVVMGCYATRAPEAVAQLPGVVRVITDKQKLAEELQDFGVADLPAGITSLRRSPARLRQGAGRLHAQLHLLHHSVGPAGRAQPGAGGRSAPKWRTWSRAAITRSF
jgi:hypothetical protein